MRKEGGGRTERWRGGAGSLFGQLWGQTSYMFMLIGVAVLQGPCAFIFPLTPHALIEPCTLPLPSVHGARR